MENNVICPCCKTSRQDEIELCIICKFPFNAPDKDKSLFIGRYIQNKGQAVAEKEKAVKNASVILWFIGAVNILLGFFLITKDISSAISTLIVGCNFVVFGILARKKESSFMFILIPSCILFLSWVLQAVIYGPSYLTQGIFFRVFFASALIYAIYKSIKVK